MLKIGLFLEKVNPRQEWQAVVLCPNRGMETDNLRPYRSLLASDQLTRVYLDEVPERPLEEVGFSILRMINVKPVESISIARNLIPISRRCQTRGGSSETDRIDRNGDLVSNA